MDNPSNTSRDRINAANERLTSQNEKLERSLQLMRESEEIGASTLNSLYYQKQQLLHTRDNLSKADVNIDGSRKILNKMSYSVWNPLYWFK